MTTPNTTAPRLTGQLSKVRESAGPVQSLHLDRGYFPPAWFRVDAILRAMIASGGVTR